MAGRIQCLDQLFGECRAVRIEPESLVEDRYRSASIATSDEVRIQSRKTIHPSSGSPSVGS